MGRFRRIRHARPDARPQERWLLRDRIQALPRLSEPGTYTHRQLDLEGQHFLPVLQQQRVVALFVKARFAYAGDDDRVVPFYLLPQLGGNFELRGFNQYRFHDNNAFMAAIEHRWYAFSGLEMALFVDAGKTVPKKARSTSPG